MGYVIGVDTGGTFTDVVLYDDAGDITSAKAPTTPERLTDGVVAALTRLAEARGGTLSTMLAEADILRFSGTTATNALLTYTGAQVGMLTTAGFEDTLAIARAISGWAGLNEEEVRHAYRHRKPPALVERAMIRGLAERVDLDGAEVVALNDAEPRPAAAELVTSGAEAIAVCLMWSVRNPTHELRIRELLAGAHPDVSVHLSHEIAPAVGEYERFMTTVCDAYVGPRLQTFLERLEGLLRENGFAGRLLLAQADGGALYPEETRPVYTLNSGPAGGVIASEQEGKRLGHRNVVCSDVGGTSFDVGLVADGTWLRAREPVMGKFHLSLPMVEVESIGAGGGSIAWVDEIGVLHAGPQSAGADPGPVAYGRGGTEPTVTDADIVLGYLNPDYFLAGELTLDVQAATEAVARVGEPLGLDALQTAAGIFEIANANMAGLLRRRVVARGFDPREFVLFAYGGAGGMHCAFYAREAGIDEVIVPAAAGTFSARGVANASLLHTRRRDVFAAMPMDADDFTSILGELEQTVRGRLAADGVDSDRQQIIYSVDMRYGSQVHTVRLEIDHRDYDAAGVEGVGERFDAAYERLYGRGSGYAAAGQFLTACCVDGYGALSPPAQAPPAALNGADTRATSTREAYFDGGMQSVQVYRASDLSPGAVLATPAIVEAPHTTVVVPPGAGARVDEFRNIRIGG